MSPARVDAPEPADRNSRKRPAEADDDQSRSKRQRTSQPKRPFITIENISPSHTSTVMTAEDMARQGLRRSIAMTLQKVGFDSSLPEAMESFVSMAETYLSSLAEDVKMFANSARRSHPLPRDFEQTLKRFNLTTSALKPHKKPPIPKSKRVPKSEPISTADLIEKDLPILGDDLDGAPDKAAKNYIPSSFPAFPSVHTYKCTPESIDAVTVVDDAASFGPEAPSQGTNGPQSQSQTQRPLAADEIPRGDPKKLREAAAKEAKAGEYALRRLMRASKIAKQKEVYSSAQREPTRRERYDLWESAMRELIEDDTKAQGKEVAPAALHGDKGRFEIADHSMIVNAEKRYYRKEVLRMGARKAAAQGVSGKS
ncbi:Bromodomain associated-domain-containing protein [Lasiosphaeria ovina]|uniref:Transcription initiation factor TFIID subunit 8 n=1 Tax=Lasiosphaeria ovina TaxID=92902 RepID=A0AAE0KGL3_9PEZI|nr:Bromodomain associated-domain-containing protein [Lasiosphaeria ovina]